MKLTETPLVSITLCVHNGEKYLKETLDSISSQTYPNIEIIIVNDASTDNSFQILKEFTKDNKNVLLINNTNNLGMAASRNVAIKNSKGKYVAIHDHDDISLPKRIEKQVAFFERDKKNEYVLCGTWGYYFGEVNCISQPPKKYIREFQIENCVFIHSSVMYRNDYLKNNNLYFDESLTIVDDYELQYRALNLEKKLAYNIPQTLVKFRVHHTSNSHGKNHEKTLELSRNMRLMQFKQLIGSELTTEEIKKIDNIFFNYKYFQNPSYKNLLETTIFFESLIDANSINKQFNPEGLKMFFNQTLNMLFFRLDKWNIQSIAWYTSNLIWLKYAQMNSFRALGYLIKVRIKNSRN